jgi:hypothetical protein
MRVTLIGNDETGLTPEDVNNIVLNWPGHQVSLVEIAFDFDTDTLNEADVLQHGRFGKSRQETDRGGPGTLRYGSRLSTKLVRCYWKKQIERYRVELELHAALLKKHSIRKIADLPLIVTKLWPKHISFKVMRWEKLESHLVRRYGSQGGRRFCAGARERAEKSMYAVNEFLSGTVHNPHRFWGSSMINRDIREALYRRGEWFGFDEEAFFVSNEPKTKKR